MWGRARAIASHSCRRRKKIFVFVFLYFDYPGCYAYALFALKSLMWACIWSVYLRFLVNRHSHPRLNHAPSSYPTLYDQLAFTFDHTYRFFQLVILKHQPRDVISRWDSNQQRYSPLDWFAVCVNSLRFSMNSFNTAIFTN